MYLYTLSLHDALPIWPLNLELLRYLHPEYKDGAIAKFEPVCDYYSLVVVLFEIGMWSPLTRVSDRHLTLNRKEFAEVDRKSTRLNSSHLGISYAVFCL